MSEEVNIQGSAPNKELVEVIGHIHNRKYDRKMDKSKIMEVFDPKNFIGFAPIQTEEFVKNEIAPVLEKYADLIGLEADLKV